MKKDFEPFEIGAVFNQLKQIMPPENAPVYQYIHLTYPLRLNAMAIDPGGIVENNNMHYSPGEVLFSTNIMLELEIKLLNEDKIECSGDETKNSIVKHTCMIMKRALNYNKGFRVTLSFKNDYRHCGLGSTGAVQSSVAVAINEIFDNPIKHENLIRYLAQNYGEEIDGNQEFLMPVQCIGGSAAQGMTDAGILVLAGNCTVVAKGTISENYKVIIGIPNDYKDMDSEQQFRAEQENLWKFKKTGERYKYKNAYNVLHRLIPAIYTQDMATIGDVIFEYRFGMGSVTNCEYTYPGLVALTDRLTYLKTEGIADVLSISSVGPSVFAITQNAKECSLAFEKNNLRVITTSICNTSYKVIEIE